MPMTPPWLNELLLGRGPIQGTVSVSADKTEKVQIAISSRSVIWVRPLYIQGMEGGKRLFNRVDEHADGFAYLEDKVHGKTNRRSDPSKIPLTKLSRWKLFLLRLALSLGLLNLGVLWGVKVFWEESANGRYVVKIVYPKKFMLMSMDGVYDVGVYLMYVIVVRQGKGPVESFDGAISLEFVGFQQKIETDNY